MLVVNVFDLFCSVTDWGEDWGADEFSGSVSTWLNSAMFVIVL